MFLLDDLLYIYQQDYYDSTRFLSFAYRNPLRWHKLQIRKTITWTLRAKLIAGVSVLIFFVLFASFGLLLGALFALVGLPVWIVSANYLTLPAVAGYKRYLQRKAAQTLAEHTNLKVVGITGSYGKTTTKHLVEGILKPSHKVLMIPGTINTDMGVAQFILAKANQLDSYDVMIVEMGAHRIGDIAWLCQITPPDYSILTAVGTMHLERFGSVDNIAKTKFEIVHAAKKLAVLNMADAGVKKYAPRLATTEADVAEVSVETRPAYEQNFAGATFEHDGHTYTTQLIAPYVPELFALAYEVARALGATPESIAKGLKEIPQVEHRLQVIHNTQTNVTVIDDSFNGNKDGFLAGLEVLQQAQGRKVVLTPGIVELGSQEGTVHGELAEEYMQGADLVLLIDTSATQYIKQAFEQKEFTNFKVYPSAKAAHADLPNVLQSGDTIIFQNDLADIY